MAGEREPDGSAVGAGAAAPVGIVLVTHGALAGELRRAMEHVVGPRERVAAVCIGPDDDMERRRDDILARIREVDGGSGVVVLTDMFGGTPSNLAISLLDRARVEVVAGVNLPMLVRLAGARGGGNPAAAAAEARDAGRKYIIVASEALRGPS